MSTYRGKGFKLPSLNWIGKEAVVVHHRDVPFRVLDKHEGHSWAGDTSENLVIQGDNLDALKALLPKYAGQVKCIYIDPPYNTGRENWVYNDNVNSPQIRKWLGEVVGSEGDTLDRHDRWLCMMYPRLTLLRQFLRIDGLIMISVDDNEVQALRYLMDEIFGRSNFVAQFIWNTDGHTDNTFSVKVNHEYIVVYSRKPKQATFGHVIDPNTREDSNLWAGVAENSITKNGPANPPSEITLPIGFPVNAEEIHLAASEIPEGLVEAMKTAKLSSNPLKRRFGKVQFPLRLDEMVAVDGRLAKPCRVFSGWANANKLKKFISQDCEPLADYGGGSLRFFLSPTGVIYYSKDRGENARNIVSVLREMGTTEKMRSELENMGINFNYPKPKELIKYLIRVASEPGDLVMDSFAGSGTTGHACLELQSEGIARRFILIEMDATTASSITAKRLRMVAEGYTDPKGQSISGTGGGFSFHKLSKEPLFDANGAIRSDVTYQQVVEFVWFLESGGGLNEYDSSESIPPLVGFHRGTAIHVLYNGVLKDKSDIGGNVLNRTSLAYLRSLSPTQPMIVYGAWTRFSSSKLAELGITFKQLPYELSVKSWF
jgi:adenine-specific DNA-methyltransferase